jgi:hypothetical protein
MEEPEIWAYTPKISDIIAFLSFILAAWSLRISHLTRRLSLSQEERKLPKTIVESLRNLVA